VAALSGLPLRLVKDQSQYHLFIKYSKNSEQTLQKSENTMVGMMF
jgi:hypothetical protein